MTTFITLDVWTCRIFNIFVLGYNITMNIFYMYCLIFPPETGQRKQPVTLLLGFLIFCNLGFCVSFTTTGILSMVGNFTFAEHLLETFLESTVDHNMTSYVTLNFFYYIQIVPAPCTFFHWVKRNIKSVFYVLVGFNVILTTAVHHGFLLSGWSRFIIFENKTNSNGFAIPMVMAHYFVMLCMTVMSSCSTVRYLHRHIQNMGKMQTPISATRLRGQMRVTITGVFQGAFFFLYTSYLIIECFTAKSYLLFLDPNMKYTLTNLFISGTTVTLGIGQNVFRQKIINIYKILKPLSKHV